MIPAFLYPSEAPDNEKFPDFWRILTDENFKSVANFLILNEIRKSPPELLSDTQCRTKLAKIKAFQELLDLPKSLLSPDSELETNDDTLADL